MRSGRGVEGRGVALPPGRRLAGQSGGGVRREELRALFRRHAAGVAVVTMAGPRGPAGFTATSVTSLSSEPPLVSFGVAATSSSAPAMLVSDTVLVHLLGAGQAEVAARFAASGADRFAPPVRWTRLPTGEPLLVETPAWLRGRVEHRLPAGDHFLVIVRVVETRVDASAAPLVYHDGRYSTVAGADR